MILLLLIVAFFSTLVLTAAMRRQAVRRNLIDIPNARSSHTRPTPRAGGIAVVLTMLASLLLLWTLDWVSGYVSTGMLTGGALVAAIGYLDDRGHVPAIRRLLVHIAGAAVVIVCAVAVGSSWMLNISTPSLLLIGGIGMLFVVWILNLFNFMDGIDGLAGAQAVTVCLSAAGLLWSVGEPRLAVLVALYGFSSLGFLVWNWPPARIFMGDSGSGFLGFSIAGLAIFTFAASGFPISGWLILMGVFIVDATVTLARRAIRGERWYEAHRSHAYQRAARQHGAHRHVTLAVVFINVFWLLPLAALTVHRPEWQVVLLMLAWLPLVLVAFWYGAGLPESAVALDSVPVRPAFTVSDEGKQV